MKRILLPFILSIGFFFATSQVPSFQWVTGFVGGPLYDHSIERDASNNIYSFGDFQGTVYFDPTCTGPFCTYNLTSQGNFPGTDVFVAKHDQMGNLIWAQQINLGDADYAEEMALDPSGNSLVTGYYQNTAVATPFRVFVSKIDVNGNFAWNRFLGPAYTPSASPESKGICTDASSNVYVSGGFHDTLDFDPGIGTFTLTVPFPNEDGYILKLNSAGGFVWVKQLVSTNSSFCYAVTKDNSGNIYSTGNFNGTADFDPGPGTFTLAPTTSTLSGFVWKLSNSGNLLWAKQIDNSIGSDIKIDNSGNIYYTGSFNGIVDFDPGLGTFTLNATNGNVFISKLDVSGNFLWAKQVGGTAQSLYLDASGNPYVSGRFISVVDMDPGPAVYTFTPMGGYDGFILNLDVNGNFNWAAQIGSTSSWEDVEDMCVGSTGDIYGVGMGDPNTDFDPGIGVQNSFYNYTYVLKLGPSPLEIKQNLDKLIFKLFPNPNNGQFNLIFDKPIEKIEIKVFNSLGQIILQKNISSTDKVSLSISDQATGIYFLEINNQDKISRYKIIKE